MEELKKEVKVNLENLLLHKEKNLIPYEKFISKMGYSIDDVNEALKLVNLSYDLKEKRILIRKRQRTSQKRTKRGKR